MHKHQPLPAKHGNRDTLMYCLHIVIIFSAYTCSGYQVLFSLPREPGDKARISSSSIITAGNSCPASSHK